MFNTFSITSGSISLWGYFFPPKHAIYSQHTYPAVTGYKFIKRFHKSGFQHKYFIGIYQQKKKLYFIKTWNKEQKDFDYYDLLNEFARGQALSGLICKYHIDNFFTPAPVELISRTGSLSLVYEYIKGRPLSEFSLRDQTKYLRQVTSGLSKLSQHLTEPDKKNFPLLGNVQYLINLPFLFLIAVARSPRSFFQILAEFVNCILSYRWYTQSLSLAHRDLSPDNILVVGKRLYLIDCSSLVLTFPNYDILRSMAAGKPESCFDTFLVHYHKLYLSAFHPSNEKT